jgi:predicted transcriptional regulator
MHRQVRQVDALTGTAAGEGLRGRLRRQHRLLDAAAGLSVRSAFPGPQLHHQPDHVRLARIGKLFPESKLPVSCTFYQSSLLQLAKVIALAAQYEVKIEEVRHIRAEGDITWSDVTLALHCQSNSFSHQINFLKALVAHGSTFLESISSRLQTRYTRAYLPLKLLILSGMTPIIKGREFIKHHEAVYEPVDKVRALAACLRITASVSADIPQAIEEMKRQKEEEFKRKAEDFKRQKKST